MAQRTPPIAVGIPVWNAAEFVAETLQSVLSQRDVRVEVLISVDGADEKSLAACKPFLGDPRVRYVVQTERLGWVRNSAAVMHADSIDGAAFGCLHLADDLMLDGYLATLRQAAENAPKAAVVFSDIETFGDRTEIIIQPSVSGEPLVRQLDVLLRHFNAVAWRGLTRIDALRRAGPLTSAATHDFAVDTVWMARMAKFGDLVRVPRALYRKRYHPANTHTAWATWSDEKKLRCWTDHCAQMLQEALGTAAMRQSRRLLYDAARVRLLQTENRVGPYSELIKESGPEAHKRMLREFHAALRRMGISPRRSFYPLAGAM